MARAAGLARFAQQTTAMVVYRRNRAPGSTFFFTATLRERSSHLLVDAIAELRDAHARARARYPFVIVATVIMPDHLHTIERNWGGEVTTAPSGVLANELRPGVPDFAARRLHPGYVADPARSIESPRARGSMLRSRRAQRIG